MSTTWVMQWLYEHLWLAPLPPPSGICSGLAPPTPLPPSSVARSGIAGSGPKVFLRLSVASWPSTRCGEILSLSDQLLRWACPLIPPTRRR